MPKQDLRAVINFGMVTKNMLALIWLSVDMA
jgi:hypothetical protein